MVPMILQELQTREYDLLATLAVRAVGPPTWAKKGLRPVLLTPGQAAERLGVHRAWIPVYQQAIEGDLVLQP
jgi:hypothetical protein